MTRRHGANALTEAGAEVARRAGSILGATRDLADCVRHSGHLLCGTLRLGVIPTLAPYVLPLLLPELHRSHPDLRLDLLETQTKSLLNELAQGTLDVLLLALPSRRPSSKRSSCSATGSCWLCRPTIPCRNAPGSASETLLRASWCYWKKATVYAIRR